jgi:hypothetical protein
MEEPRNKSESTVRDMVIRQVIAVGGVVLAAWLTKRVSQPDFGQLFRMRTALVVKRVADSQVRAWENVASHAANAYQKARV